MTTFENLELLYNQFFNLTDEINKMIENEDYNAAISKLEYKDKLIKKLSVTKKTVELNEENKQKLSLIEETLKEKDQNILKFLTNLRIELSEELKDTKNRLKMNTAYEIKKESNSGLMVDISE